MQNHNKNDDEGEKGHFLKEIRENTYARLRRLLNTKRISESTFKKYKVVIDNFLSEYDEINRNTIDKFLSQYKSYYAFFALKHLLYANGYHQLYDELEKPRQIEHEVKRPLMSFQEVMQRIDSIDDDVMRTIARIQFLTAKRAKEVIMLKKDDITFKDTSVEFRFILKGNREDIKEVPKSLLKEWHFLYELWSNTPTYESIFMPQNRTFHTFYVKYLNTLKEIGFKTHDLRSMMATLVYQKTKDILIVKEVLKHANIKHTLRYIKDDTKEKAKKPAELIL